MSGETTAAAGASSAEPARRPSVLVVDDERGPRESLRMILSPEYEVLLAKNGSQALEILRQQPVELVTLDLHMPGIKGRELMHLVHDEFPGVQIIVITGCGSVGSAADGIRCGIADYLQKPFDVVQVSSAVARAISRQRARARLTSFLDQLGGVVGRGRDAEAILSDVARSEKLRGRIGGVFGEGGRLVLEDEMDRGRTLDFLQVLAETIEVKDEYMSGHARRVAFYASLLAHRLGIPQAEHEAIRVAGFLHDLGKVGVPSELLARPGPLEAGERELLEEHPAIGERLIAPLDLAPGICTTVRHHHEWWDGSGYPDGLSGTQIPMAARIVAVADAFDAMNSDRPYRAALSRDLVVGEFRRFAGQQFDPELVKEFLAILETGVCELDPEWVAEAVTQATGISGPEPIS